MNMSLDIAWKSLNKKKEELCGDTVEIIKTEDSDILLLSDGMGSGVSKYFVDADDKNHGYYAEKWRFY